MKRRFLPVREVIAMVTYDGLFQYTLVILTAISLFYNIYKNKKQFLNKRNTALPPTDWRCFFTPVSYTHLDVYKRQVFKQMMYLLFLKKNMKKNLLIKNNSPTANGKDKKMTPEEWKKVEDALSSPYGRVEFKIDGYDITIMLSLIHIWLRHRPFTAESWVQFPYGSPHRNAKIINLPLHLYCIDNGACLRRQLMVQCVRS